jgi:subtilisin family serine protease
MNNAIRSVLFSSSLVFASTLAQAQLLPPVEVDANGAAYWRGEVLIQFKPSVTDAQIADAFAQASLNLIKHVRTVAMEDAGRIGVTRASTSLPLPAALRVLSNLPGVQFAQPNWYYTSQADSDDPLYLDGSLWGMYGDDAPSSIGPGSTTNPYGSQAEKAWAAGITGSRDIFVAVVDASGVQFDHPDLAANTWTNPGEIPGNGIDDDGNGYVDDVHGWNSFADNGDVYETTNSAHGTHVAGTIGAVGGNGIGVAGVNWSVGLIPVKFGQNGGGSTLDALQAIDYVTALKTAKGLNIVAVNASWGTYPGAAPDQALLDSVTRAAHAGILLVAASMNNNTNTDTRAVYPACFDTTAGAGYDSVISVAAIDQNGLKASFSDYGQQTVDLGAPGVAIQSTKLGGTYGTMSGTSMATPHVAGAIALYASTHPGASAWQAKADLFNYGVRATESLNGITTTGGRLDISKLLLAPVIGLDAPNTPANLQPTVISGGRVDLTWADQSSDELGFAIEHSTDGQNFFLADTVGANVTSYSDRTVSPATTYYYRIRSYNPGGNSDYTYTPLPVQTPYVALPAAPSNLTSAALARGGVSLSWSDRSNNEDGFQIERKTGTSSWQLLTIVAANTVKLTDNSTVSRTTYSYRVRAFNAAGVSTYSNEVTVKAK